MNTETPTYDDKTPSELRVIARRKCRDSGHPSSWTALASRAACLEYLATGSVPREAAAQAAEPPQQAEIRTVLTVATTPGPGEMDASAAMASLPSMLDAAIKRRVDEEWDRVKALTPQELSVTIDGQKRDLPPMLVHESVADVLKVFEAGISSGVLLVGPAGSGKTTIAEHISKILGLGFTFASLSGGTTEGSIFGRLAPDETGAFKFRASPFVETWQTGGIHLWDEVDACDPNVFVAVNAPMANGHLAVPDAGEGARVIKRHPKTFIIAAANTFGRGADRMYVGRNSLDAATLDRWSVSTIEVDYDTRIEKVMTESILEGRSDGSEWLDWCWLVRKKIHEAKLRRLMSTRTIVNGAKLLSVGVTRKQLQERYFAGWSKDEYEKAKVVAA